MLYRICFRVIDIRIVILKDLQINWSDISEFLLTNESMNINDYLNIDYILLWHFGSISGITNSIQKILFTRIC